MWLLNEAAVAAAEWQKCAQKEEAEVTATIKTAYICIHTCMLHLKLTNHPCANRSPHIKWY